MLASEYPLDICQLYLVSQLHSMLVMISTCIWTHILPCLVPAIYSLTVHSTLYNYVYKLLLCWVKMNKNLNKLVLSSPDMSCTWSWLSRKNGMFTAFVICHPSCFVNGGRWDHKTHSCDDDSLIWNMSSRRTNVWLRWELSWVLLSLPTDWTSHVFFDLKLETFTYKWKFLTFKPQPHKFT